MYWHELNEQGRSDLEIEDGKAWFEINDHIHEWEETEV